MEQSVAWIISLAMKLTRTAFSFWNAKQKSEGNPCYIDLLRILGMDFFFAEDGAQYKVIISILQNEKKKYGFCQ
jgi:hypothetical protein